MSPDPTRISLSAKDGMDPEKRHMTGVTAHGDIPFDVPFISHVAGNLYMGGCQTGLRLPEKFKHLVSLYPWKAYRVKHELDSSLTVRLYDSLDQSLDKFIELAEWVRRRAEDAPVLVHCQAGLNRSGLVCALALRLGFDGPDGAIPPMLPGQAVEFLRERRSPACLSNPAFESAVSQFQVGFYGDHYFVPAP